MSKADRLLELFERDEAFVSLREVTEGGEGPCSVFGVSEGAAHFVCAGLLKGGANAVVITATEKEAKQLCESLQALLGGCVYIPAREIVLFGAYATSGELNAKRIAAMDALIGGSAKVACLSVEAAMQACAPPEAFLEAQMPIKEGDILSHGQILHTLLQLGYERVEKVEGMGQFRLSGSILDIFSPTYKNPVRIEFFDDEVDTVRFFDEITQRSLERMSDVVIAPATPMPIDQSAKQRALKALKQGAKAANEQLLQTLELMQSELAQDVTNGLHEQFLPLFYEGALISDYVNDAQIYLIEPHALDERAKSIYSQFNENFTGHIETKSCLRKQHEQLFSPHVLFEKLCTPKTVCFFTFSRTFSQIAPKQLIKLEVNDASQYAANLEGLAQDIRTLKERKTAVLLYAGARANTLLGALNDLGAQCAYAPVLNRPPVQGEALILAQSITHGMESRQLHCSVFSEREIYGIKKRAVEVHKKRNVSKIDIFADLQIGDYVVHQTHGIGVFNGFESITREGITRAYLIIQYYGSDKLFVPTDQLDRVQKFIGAQDRAPKISKLGGDQWNKSVAKVRQSVKELAFDLVRLYADRKQVKGYAFSPDSLWQKQLEDAFAYDETPDQLNCIEQIKKDMESGIVMDRLLCGDVGYGKTEVALRAAFKAVQDSKQVAILVPTTVLAAQHYQTLLSRFSGYPVNVALLCRYRSASEQRQTLRNLKSGVCDVVIGTHRLLSNDVVFHDLGLMIIDEEQRFGVGHKEQIKNMRKNIDVLTLSATPIPRTLHMALTGLRDMSVIETPPEERYPVQTYVVEYSGALVAEAIKKEIGRGGQVFFLYNRVATMERFAAELRKLVPEASLVIAHGQMGQGQLEKTMLCFMEKEYDVLLCSTIIESGIDIPNVNTIIVHDADKMGLSQLYQLRGRVGRTNRLAYAYLTFERDKVISEIAQKRLKALREFTQLGSGFKIAMRDLEIRGAGNLLGANQHGHMDDVGYDMYCRLVEEEVSQARGEKTALDVDTQIDVPIEAHIPKEYIQDETQRLEVYKLISSINSRPGMLEVQEELEDRFGTIPTGVQNLMDIATLKAYAKAAQIMQLFIGKGALTLRFHDAAQIDAENLLTLVTQTPGCSLQNGAMVVYVKLAQKTIEQIVSFALDFVQRIFICN